MKCYTCHFWNQDGTEAYQGHCGLYSINCITAVFSNKTPTRFVKKEEVKVISELKLKGSEEDKVKGETIFMDDENYVDARQNRRRQNATYPDITELTDESKAELRKLGRRRK